MNKIGVSGAAGSGKSTITNLISNKYKIPVIKENVRSWLRINNYSNPWELPWREQIKLQKKYLAFKIKHEASNKSFISDRTTLDCVVSLFLRSPQPPDFINQKEVIQCAFTHASKIYDYIIIPHYKSIFCQNDGCRNTDVHVRAREEYCTIGLCKLLNIPHIIVKTSNLNLRIEKISKLIK